VSESGRHPWTPDWPACGSVSRSRRRGGGGPRERAPASAGAWRPTRRKRTSQHAGEVPSPRVDKLSHPTRHCAGKLGDYAASAAYETGFTSGALGRRVSRPAKAPSGEQANTAQRARLGDFGRPGKVSESQRIPGLCPGCTSQARQSFGSGGQARGARTAWRTRSGGFGWQRGRRGGACWHAEPGSSRSLRRSSGLDATEQQGGNGRSDAVRLPARGILRRV